MHRVALALAWVPAALGCDRPAPAAEPPPPRWVYAPPTQPLSLGPLRGRLGRGQAPALALPAGITGDAGAPLRLATPFPVPGDGPARAVLYGLDGGRAAIELIEVDTGRVAWRARPCAGPVVGVTAEVTVCVDGTEIRGVGHDGARRWSREGAFLALTEDHVLVATESGARVLDAADGEELASVPLPRGVALESVLASCGDAGRELFASGQDGRLARIAEAKGGPAVAWAVPAAPILELDPCTGGTVLVRIGGAPSTLVAIDRATGRVTGRVEGVRGVWPARTGGGGSGDDDDGGGGSTGTGTGAIEIATAAGVARWPRDLAGEPEALALPPLGELIASRGDRRLVRATERTAVLLDAAGVAAHLPFAWRGGAIGERALLAASWTGSAGETVHRLGLPARAPRRPLRLPRAAPVALPAELRDLPAPARLEDAAAIPKPDTAMYGLAGAALDPELPARLYALTLERETADDRAAGVAAIDLGARAWRWQRGDGCGPGVPVALAVARGAVVCGARTAAPPSATVTATSPDGAALWQWEGDNLDHLQAAGSTVLIHDAGRLLILDAGTGHLRGRLAGDDGAPMRAAVLALGETTYTVTYERGRLVLRLPAAGLLPVWSLAVDGAVRAISPSLDGVLVELDDGDAYRVDLRTAAVTPLPGLGLVWAAPGDLVTGHTAGGPIPGPPAPPPKPPKPGARPAPILEADDDRPAMWTPIPVGPPLGDSFQLTLYEPTGGLRARNDYALAPPVVAAFARGPAGSPLVLASGPGLRELLVLDPRSGAPLRRVQLPPAEDAAARLVFGTVVDGTPVAGALLPSPLRAVLF